MEEEHQHRWRGDRILARTFKFKQPHPPPFLLMSFETKARFEPRSGIAIAAAFAAAITSSNFQNNSASSNFDNSAHCMPRINKDKGKQGNAKSIRASAAERRGAQKGGGVSAGNLHDQLDPNDKSDQAFRMVFCFGMGVNEALHITQANISRQALHRRVKRARDKAREKEDAKQAATSLLSLMLPFGRRAGRMPLSGLISMRPSFNHCTQGWPRR